MPDNPVPFADWPKVLAGVTGVIVNGERRVSTAELISLVGAANRIDTWNRLKRTMHSLGWSGPKAMRINGGLLLKGYHRPAASELQPADQGLRAPDPPASPTPLAAGRPPHELELPTAVMPEELAKRLENATALGLQKLEDILRIPTDHLNGNVLRAQTAAAATAIQAQLRADENRLRIRREGDVLARLIKTIEEERKKLPRAPRRKRIAQTPTTPAADATQVRSEA
jgi:hypothetical protein